MLSGEMGCRGLGAGLGVRCLGSGVLGCGVWGRGCGVGCGVWGVGLGGIRPLIRGPVQAGSGASVLPATRLHSDTRCQGPAGGSP